MSEFLPSPPQLWERFNRWWRWYPDIELGLDISRVRFTDEWLKGMEQPLRNALQFMTRLEAGERVNVTENRQVGHYWLRAPDLAPDPQITNAINQEQERVKDFVLNVYSGRIAGAGGPFQHVVWIGIGGSALGPQLLHHCFADPDKSRLLFWFLDNTDPDGICRVLKALRSELGRTLCVIVSKSGTTRETNNALEIVRSAYHRTSLSFESHAVAITQADTIMDQIAKTQNWLNRFYIWEWVGGRTSITSAVGLLALGLISGNPKTIDMFLTGAAACDRLTRQADLDHNPAALLAAMWYFLTDGRGSRDMVILPYKDRLELFARYLQQLVMESLGKKQALDGRFVYQGLTVYGNKGSTDQHAYVQQLRDGLPNFFVVFIDVLKDLPDPVCEADPAAVARAGDYLAGFLTGTRNALFEADRQSITLTLETLSPYSLGALIALFERTVGLYAYLINVNAYDQPGVEAGKKGAEAAVQLQSKIIDILKHNKGRRYTAEELASAVGQPDAVETIFRLCRRLSVNQRAGIRCSAAPRPAEYQFWAE